MRPTCLLVTPALASANNGNWQTAHRWQQFASKTNPIRLALNYDGQESPHCAIALHAYRSADSIALLKQRKIPCALVLTGTDLYRDIHTQEKAQQALAAADILVVLNDRGIAELPSQYRHKARCIFQSAPSRAHLAPRMRTEDFAFVGHLRHEKDPLTPARALGYLDNPRIRLVVAGQAHSSQDGSAQDMLAYAQRDARIQLLGGLTHPKARQLIARSQALILSSMMEGGANVLIEAVTSGTPVLASYISGNIGMLGEDYPGYFPLGNAQALARLIERFLHNAEFRQSLRLACARRQPNFAPEAEAGKVRALLQDLLTLRPRA